MNVLRKEITDIIDCLYRVSLKAVVIKNEKLLMTHEKEGFYSLPGGGLDYGENIEKAIKRELEEELAITKGIISVDPSPIHTANKGVLHGIPRFHLYFRVDLEVKKDDDAELSYRWVSRNELKSIDVSPTLPRDWLLKLLQ